MSLPQLEVLLDRRAVSEVIGPITGTRRAEVARIEVFKLRPERRCSLGYELFAGDRRWRLFAKTFHNRRGATVFDNMHPIHLALDGSGLTVPRPLAYFPHLHLLVTEFVAGKPFATDLYGDRPESASREMARALARLHGTGVTCKRRWTSADELRTTAAAIDTDGVPSEDARRVLDSLALCAEQFPVVPEGPIHRDFYPEQLIATPSGKALLDLDDARTGDPAVDLGNCLAHLTLRATQFPSLRRACSRARGVFVDAYVAASDRPVDRAGLVERIAFYETASLVRLAGVYARRHRWADRLPRLLLEQCLEPPRRSVAC